MDQDLDSIQLIESKYVITTRLAYSQNQFDNEFSIINANKLNDNSKKTFEFNHNLFKYLDPRRILNLFTILNLITEYNIRKDLLADFLSGITVGILHIPAGLAYGALTSLNPVNGLYVSFYSGCTYILFGTSKHLSVGTYAIISLMVYSTLNKVETTYLDTNEYNLFKQSLSNINNTDQADLLDSQHLMSFRLKVSTSLAFWCGIIQIVLAILRVGIIYKYLSNAMLRGFTTAAACFIFTTQLQHILGIYPKTKSNIPVLKLLFAYIRIFERIKIINWAAVLISFISITFLVTMRIHVNERFKKQMRNIPIPIELIVIISGTFCSYFFSLNEKFQLPIVGHIPSGLAEPSLPDFSKTMFSNVIQDAFIIAIVTFTSSISVSDIYARKHKYKIDSNREIFALGMSNLVGSFFQCFVCCGALARTAVFESSGGRTQIVTVVASGMLLSVLLWLSALLEMLPKACLGSIIISALINMFKQFKDIKYYWKLDKIDFALWMITFVSCILFDIDIGLCIGILSVFILNTYRNQKMSVITLGQIKDFEIHSDISKYMANEYDHIKIIQPTQSLYYINCDQFQSCLNEICPLKEAIPHKSLIENCISNYGCETKSNKKSVSVPSESLNMINENGHNTLPRKMFKIIIIDFSMIHFVDENGVKCLEKLLNEYKKQGVRIIFTNCNETVKEFFIRMKCKWNDLIYLTVRDAIVLNNF